MFYKVFWNIAGFCHVFFPWTVLSYPTHFGGNQTFEIYGKFAGISLTIAHRLGWCHIMTPVYWELPLFDPEVFGPNDFWKKQNLPTNNWHQVGYCQRINHYPKIFVTASDRTVNIGQTYAEGLGTGSKKRRNHAIRRLPFQLIRYTDEGRWIIECQWCETRDLFFGMAATTFRLEWRCTLKSFLFGTGAVSCTDYEDPYPPDPTTVTSFDVNVAGEYVFYYTCKLENSHSK